MHARFLRRGVTRGLIRGTAAVLAGVLVLSGCSGDEEEPGAETSDSPSESATEEEPYLPVPDGVELTAQGSELSVGETATVAYEPRQDVVGALDIRVTKLEKASFKLFVGWKLTPQTRKTQPYFVTAKVTNVGDTDLGGRSVSPPLYAVDGDNKLIEASTFASSFKPCPSQALPKKFQNGDTTTTCLVYLAPNRGDLTAASFRPTEAFVPITWTGKVVLADELRKDKKRAGKKGGDRKKKGSRG
ncbi:MAG: hypothetical protein ACRDOM_09445 [Nocardioides sp.]